MPSRSAIFRLLHRMPIPRLSDLPLRFQLLSGFSVVLLALAGLGLLAYRGTRSQAQANRAVAIETASCQLADSLFIGLLEMETDYRAFLSGGKEEHLAAYRHGAATFPDKLAGLETLAAANPSELQRWQRLGQLVHGWQQDVVEPGIRFRQSLTGESDPGADPFLIGNRAEDRARFATIRQLIEDFNNGEELERAQFVAAAGAVTLQTRQIVVWGTAAVAVLSLLVALLLARSIVGSMVTVAKTSEAIQRGDLSRRTGLRRKDEIGQASRSFDRMADQLEATLREQELRAETEAQERAVLALILNSMNEAVFEVDATDRLRRANDGTALLVGQPIDSLIGRRARDVFRWEDESGRVLDEDELPRHEALATGRQQESTHVYCRKPDGTRIPVSLTSTPVLDSHGQLVAAVQVVRDITREAEANRLKDQIISLVSHELRTPVGHIKGFASSLLASDVEWDAGTIHDFILEIDRETDRLSRLITDILDISKIESGPALRRESLSPAAIAIRAIEAAQQATADHVVVNDVSDALPWISVDGSQLERVLCNLLENAAKYSPTGTKIRLTAESKAGNVEWRVEDQGPGVPLEYRQRIFEKFFRVPAQGRRPPGTGLGLPICEDIVEAHGGRIWLEDREGGGSRFCFAIPTQDCELPPVPTATIAGTDYRRGLLLTD